MNTTPEKPVITYWQEPVLAYLSAIAPLGEEFIINTADIARDLGYKDRRNIYYALRRLRDIGAITLVLTGKNWRYTTLTCHMREEQCTVIEKMPGGRALRAARHHGITVAELCKARQRSSVAECAPVEPVKSSPKPVIRYAGFDKHEKVRA